MQSGQVRCNSRKQTEVVARSTNRFEPEVPRNDVVTLEQPTDVSGRKIIHVTVRLPMMSIAPGRTDPPHIVHVRHYDHQYSAWDEGSHRRSDQADRILDVLENIVEYCDVG